jgi:hypothetical protein
VRARDALNPAAWRSRSVSKTRGGRGDDHGAIKAAGPDAARGKSSGADVEASVARLVEFSGCSVAKLAVYADRDLALADLGPEE